MLHALEQARRSVMPRALMSQVPKSALKGSAALFWGKAALQTFEALKPQLAIVIAPNSDQQTQKGSIYLGEHPLPGPGSFAAGQAILEYFDFLRRKSVKKLTVFLSGGASSLAWIRPASITQEALDRKLRQLYAKPLSIDQLNRKRSEFCVLKAGGAAHWLRRLAPDVQVQVFLVSDVAPYGASVVGSGPFYDGQIEHTVLADNSTLLRNFASEARQAGVRVHTEKPGWIAPMDRWVTGIETKINLALQHRETGLFLWGGEPLLRLPLSLSHSHARGGRQAHLAARLSLTFREALRQNRMEIICASSDGVDGNSGSSGVYLQNRVATPRQLQTALRNFNTAPVLDAMSALLPSVSTGTNVQDLVAVWIKETSKPLSSQPRSHPV